MNQTAAQTTVVPFPSKMPVPMQGGNTDTDASPERVVLGTVTQIEQGSWQAMTEQGILICTTSSFDHAVAEVRDHHLTTGGASER